MDKEKITTITISGGVLNGVQLEGFSEEEILNTKVLLIDYDDSPDGNAEKVPFQSCLTTCYSVTDNVKTK